MSLIGPSDHEPSALLSDETLSALEMREQPFLRPETPADTFSDDITTDQLADIKQALITGDDLLLILGEPGVGKSTLLSQLGDNSGLRIQCFSVQGNTRFSAVNLFGGMLEAFKREPPDNLKTMLDELVPCLQGMISNNTLSTVIIDDADAVDEVELTRLLSAMLYMNSEDETLMRIALSATPAFEARIPELLPEGADLPYSTLAIEPFEHERAAHYLAWRLERASDAAGIPFDEAQIVEMNASAKGNPRKLHEIVADELNARHGELEPALPPELLTSSQGNGSSLGASLMTGRSPKLLLGGLGVLLIGLGLLLFLPGGGEESADRYAVVEQRKLDEANADRLALVDEDAPSSDLASSDADSPNPEPAQTQDSPPAEPSAADAPTPETVDSSGEGASPDANTLEASEASTPANTDDVITVIEESAPSSSSSASAQQSDDSVQGNASEPAETPETDSDSNEISLERAGTLTDQTDESLAAGPTTSADDVVETEQGEVALAGQKQPSEVEQTPSEPADSVPELPESDELVDALDVPGTASQAVEPAAAEPPTPAAAPAPAPAPAPNPVSDPSAPSSDGMESPNWILTQNPDLYTIQMIASTSQGEVEAFLTEANLKGPNSIFTFQRGGVDWYALVHGLYDSVEDARSAIIRMPDAALSFQPWIRSIGRVQNSLRK